MGYLGIRKNVESLQAHFLKQTDVTINAYKVLLLCSKTTSLHNMQLHTSGWNVEIILINFPQNLWKFDENLSNIKIYKKKDYTRELFVTCGHIWHFNIKKTCLLIRHTVRENLVEIQHFRHVNSLQILVKSKSTP